ncbi:Putative D-isomer specific 2-hydroxyacid dehydrogenase [Penicillium brasilianum]|uniref:Putative D-isomer specific 2-hydroxyacid dehydrogenase n=1 Tax=Penicillium brasilianum TaxID=104259 RepID=A0A0F7TRY5_PENBI|nr:Putative D-isomer specific 2-hydroxyacid dehydrogenase [Penicillium brasilianum]
MDYINENSEAIENYYAEKRPSTPVKNGDPVMRSREDDLCVWQCALRFKKMSLIAMIAAFSASLDGYQINLNGGIVSNKGFIRQMEPLKTTVIEGKYVSAWSGIQSAGQTVGQILLQYATERFGRKIALYIIWADLVVSIFIETFATRWDHWLVAKLFSGMGVGMLQSTLPLYLSELAPTQLRGFYINAYSFWFVVGQIFASVALNQLAARDPYEFRLPIYTQWAMIGAIIFIFLLLPESPWWLVSKGKLDKAAKVLNFFNGKVDGYDVQEQIEVMTTTVAQERIMAEQNSEEDTWAVFRGRNLIRFIIASWPKIVQQFVGLSVFNTNATYFFQNAGNKNPFQVTVILSCVQLISVLLTATTTDRFGRRPLTVYPYAVTTVSVLCLGIIGCFDYTKPSTSSLLVFFACLATLSTTGASAIGYAYAAEVPQQRLRAKTAGWALAFSNAIAIMLSFCTPLMINGSAKWGVKTGFFFAGTGTVSTVIAWFILPELTRRTPAEIDEMFEKKVSLRKFKGYVTEVQMRANEQHQDAKHTTA